MNDNIRIILMSIASMQILFCIILLFVRGSEFKQIIDYVKNSGRNHFFADLLMIGLNILDFTGRRGLKLDIGRTRRLRKVMADNHGSVENGKFFYLVLRARQITLIFCAVPVILITIAVTGGWLHSYSALLVFLEIVMTGMSLYRLEWKETGAHEDRKEELMVHFPSVVSKLTLLVSAGLPLREAWKKVAYSGEGILYEEMKKVTTNMENGMLEIEAYRTFGERCEEKEIKKFTSMMIQNLQKGSDDLTKYLREISSELWQVRKQKAVVKGQRASTKMMLVNGLIFAAIMLMVIVPVFMKVKI